MRDRKKPYGKNSKTGKKLLAMYRAAFEHFGHADWWPGDTPFEIIIGAFLTQNTNWKNVEKAIENLKAQNLLCAHRMWHAGDAEIAGLIRPSGYYNVKTRRIKNFLACLHTDFGGSLERMFELDAAHLRDVLLAVKGAGRETADSIVLYAAGKCTFVVDAYTKRIFSRHGFFDPDTDYDDVKAFFESNLPRKTELFNDYHAQIVNVAKHFCLKKSPLCGQCPLRDFLPAKGPAKI